MPKTEAQKRYEKEKLKKLSISMKKDRYAELEKIATDCGLGSVGALYKAALSYVLESGMDISELKKYIWYIKSLVCRLKSIISLISMPHGIVCRVFSYVPKKGKILGLWRNVKDCKFYWLYIRAAAVCVRCQEQRKAYKSIKIYC